MPADNNVISDGRQRLDDVLHEQLKRQVGKEFAAELSGAGPVRRMLIRGRIAREVRRRLRREAPGDALYLRR